MKFFLAFLLLTFPLLAVQEGTFIEYQEVTKETLKDDNALEKSYQNPLLDYTEAPTKKKELTLQQKIANYFGTFVTSSPYPGVRATFEGTELMSSLSSVNKDLQILLELEQSNEFMKKEDIPYPIHPRIFLSGQIEVAGFIQKDARDHARSDIDLIDAELDFLIVVSPWIYGYISIEYDNGLDPAFSSSRVKGSRIHGDSIFVTLGDLSEEPWYGTIGQTFIPFGQYTTFTAVHDPLTKLLFRTIARNVNLGFFNNRIQFAAYVLKGGSHADSGNNINNYGVNLGIHFEIKKVDCKIAVGGIRNVADSIGMQSVFGDPRNREKLRHVVPGINANTNISWGNWTLIGAYNQALRPFSARDAAFSVNGTKFKGARPMAFDGELAYSFNIGKRSSSIAFAYNRSYKALGFNVPKERITLTWALYVFRGNLLSLELNSDKLYDKNNRAAGSIARGNPYFIDSRNLGHRDYSLSVDYLLYF